MRNLTAVFLVVSTDKAISGVLYSVLGTVIGDSKV